MGLDFWNWTIARKDEIARAVDAQVKNAMRPIRGWGNSTTKTQEILFQTALLGELYDYAAYSDTYRTITNTLQRELFRNGAEWKSRFAAKCTACDREYKTKPDACECGGMLREPDQMQKATFDEFIKKANDNGHSLLEVFEHIEPDLEVMDNAFLLILKKYSFSASGEIVGGTVLEILRADPLYMRKIIDRQGRMGYDFDTSLPTLVCPEHRTFVQINTQNCKTCGKRLYPAHFQTWNTDKVVYYFAGECVHLTKYTKTLFYGFPPALTVLTKVKTLMAMDNMMNRAYFGQKTPKGLALVRTNNPESMEKEWEAFLDRAQKDPYGIYPLFVPSKGDDSGKLVEYIEFMRSPEEMQFIETRTELKQTVGAFFGVMPIFQADLSTSAGLNNEGLTITVTTRAIESGQGMFNNKVLPFLLSQFGISDWEYVLKPPEEKDEMAEKQREAQEIANAQAMQQLGFKVERTADGKFKYSAKPEPQEQAAPEPSQKPAELPALNAARLDGQPQKPTA